MECTFLNLKLQIQKIWRLTRKNKHFCIDYISNTPVFGFTPNTIFLSSKKKLMLHVVICMIVKAVTVMLIFYII